MHTKSSTGNPAQEQQEAEILDAKRLAEHLEAHQNLTVELAIFPIESSRRAEIESALLDQRNAAITIVDRHMRKNLRPMLAKRFQNRGLDWTKVKVGDVPDSGDAMVRYTELIGDFFVTVLSNINDPLWKLHSISQMRSYVATALSRDILDILRRSKRQLDVIGKEDESGFDAALAAQAKHWFVRQSENFEATLDYESALQIVLGWEQSDDKNLRELANVFLLYFVAEMTMSQIAGDIGLSIPTVSRRLKAAIEGIREELDVTL